LTLAKENDVDKTPERTPDDIDPGAAADELVQRVTGVHPEDVVPGQAHAAPPSETMNIEEEHEPSEHSFWPVVVAVSTLIIGAGFLTTLVVTAIGAIVLLFAVIGWFTEPWVS
jgi:hypothetical protein